MRSFSSSGSWETALAALGHSPVKESDLKALLMAEARAEEAARRRMFGPVHGLTTPPTNEKTLDRARQARAGAERGEEAEAEAEQLRKALSAEAAREEEQRRVEEEESAARLARTRAKAEAAARDVAAREAKQQKAREAAEAKRKAEAEAKARAEAIARAEAERIACAPERTSNYRR